MIIILKGIIKQPVIKQIRTFISLSVLYECFFSFLIKGCVNFEKLVRFRRQAFIVYENCRKFENTDRNILPKTYSF